MLVTRKPVCEKVFSVKFDSFMSFQGQGTSLCKKASQKLCALVRIVNYMDFMMREALVKTYMTS